MLTILEGPDGGGKTTFTRGYASGAPVYDHGPYPDATARTLPILYAPMIQEARESRRLVVGDRSWLAEPVYGAAYRNGANRLTVVARRMLERAALDARAVVALFLPGIERCVETFAARRGEEYLDSVGQLEAVYAGYLGYLVDGPMRPGLFGYLTDLPLVVADWTRHRPGQLAELIEAARPRFGHGPGAGHLDQGSVLLVGDRPSEPDPVLRDAPFTSFHRGGCSAWLAELLEEEGVPERRLYWVNANTTGGTVRRRELTELLEQHAFREVVALGENAAHSLRSIGLAYLRSVEHPQYWKRFHHHERYPLLDVLQEVLR